MGGLARRAGAIKSIQQQNGELLLVDAGDSLSLDKTNAERYSLFQISAMNSLKYDAVNVGVMDFYSGLDLLRECRSKAQFPFVASNLIPSEGVGPLGEKFIVKKVGGIKVGILGIMSPELFEKTYADRYAGLLRVSPPESALKELLPELKSKVDVIVLLSNCGFGVTKELVRTVPGIDLAIVSGPDKKEKLWLEKPSGPAVVTSSYKGVELGVVDLSFLANRQIEEVRGKTIELNESVAADETINKEVEAVYDPPKKPLVTLRATGPALKKDLSSDQNDLLKLSPQEYIERLHKPADQKGANQ